MERGALAVLNEEQKKAYWRYNRNLTCALLAIWFLVSYLMGGWWAESFNKFSFLGFPLGYYMAAQGSLAVFVVLIALYAKLMNKKDLEYGIREDE